MSERVKWIEHQGLKILYEDFSNLPEDEFIKEIQKVDKAMIESGDKDVFVLSNMVNVRMTDATKDAGQAVIDATKPHGITIHTTMVGLSKIQRIIANAVIKDVYFARDEEDAKEWLLRKAEKEKAKQPVS